jgi:hypothetical protein
MMFLLLKIIKQYSRSIQELDTAPFLEENSKTDCWLFEEAKPTKTTSNFSLKTRLVQINFKRFFCD